MKLLTRISAFLLTLCILTGTCAHALAVTTSDVHIIQLSSQQSGEQYTHSAVMDGKEIAQYDYTWHADPTAFHDEVKNSPAEYYTGTKPTGEDAVYIAHDIYYYPVQEQDNFQQVNYDGETEWVSFYQIPGYENYIFSTLPVLKTGFPSQMMHTPEEAYQNAVLHITQAGTYVLEGSWHGQIRVDLGEDAFDDESQKVTLILGGVDISCSVAAGVVFASVYECDNGWEDAQNHSHKVDTTNAGANIVIADGTVNNVSGTNIFRILKTQYKDEDSEDTYPAQKKRLKVDGAFYSYQSMNITGQQAGTGVLNITSGFEGVNSELHLTVNGGNVNIFSQDDGINVNEDGVSVLTVNGGSVHICAGLGAEGDGVDSNGYLVINGGTVISAANPAADSGLDSDCGSFVNGGTVVALGSAMDWAEADDTADTTQAILNLRFQGAQSESEAIVITDTDNKVVFAYDPDKDEVAGANSRTYSGAIVSGEGLKVGETYKLFVGGDVTGSEISGVYDPTSVTAFTGATMQCYFGNTLGGMGGGFRPDGVPPGGMQGDRPNGGQENPPQMPGNGTGNPQEPPAEAPSMDRQPGAQGQIQPNGATCTYQTEFTLSQKVNAFASITDYRHDLQKATDSEYYVCSGCGNKYEDAEGTVLLSDGAKATPTGNEVLPYVLCFLAGAVVASAVFSIVLLLRRKKV